MSSQLKISADTSEVKKSILDIGKTIKDLKGSKVQIFSNEDKKFIKSEMKKEIGLMKNKLKENREEIKKLVEVQSDLVSGSKEELEIRKKILEAYKVQAKLGKQLGDTQHAAKSGGSLDSSGGGMMSKLMGLARLVPGLAAVATIGYAMSKGMQANSQYQSGVGARNRLKGLGVGEDSFGSASDLARVGLSEQDMIQRRADATARLGRQGSSTAGEMRKAGFERAFGLDGGTMTGIANQFRGSMGGEGADQAQLKLQASVFAAGLEDAIGPYLESAVQLLTHINENGEANMAEMTGLLAQLTKDGERTPEQLAKQFMGINDSVKGAKGEQSAFLQAAFARAGIGGGTIGGTKFSMESGGIMGMDQNQLAKRGYNPELLKNMGANGMFSGVGKRTGAILDMMKSSGGMKAGESISGITSPDKMIGMGNLANNVFGTKGNQGFDALMMLEQVQKKQMGQKDFDRKLKEMQEGNDPSLSRLDKINTSLSGQTEVLNKINENLMESLGKEAVQAANVLTQADNQGIGGITGVAGAVNKSGATKAAGTIAQKTGSYLFGGGLGESLFDLDKGDDDRKFGKMTSDAAVNKHRKKMLKQWHPDWSDEQVDQRIKDKPLQDTSFPTAKDIGKEVANALKSVPIVNQNNVKIQPMVGGVNDKTSK